MWRATARQSIPCLLSGAALLCALAIALSGCGVTGSAGASTTGKPVIVTERDFKIAAPEQVSAGTVELSVRNEGPDAHELIVVRQHDHPLPLRRDGLTVDEDAVEKATAGNLEPGAPGSERELTVHLTPGRYVLLCNMSGHYMGGMHTELLVR
jgi:uncharacterized cupredoxin-like copper-binding protein